MKNTRRKTVFGLEGRLCQRIYLELLGSGTLSLTVMFLLFNITGIFHHKAKCTENERDRQGRGPRELHRPTNIRISPG